MAERGTYLPKWEIIIIVKKIDYINKALTEFSECVNIGSKNFNSVFEKTADVYELSCIKAMLDEITQVHIYKSDKTDGEQIISHGMTGDGKRADIACCVENGKTVSEEDKNDLTFMCRMIYVIMGKMRLMGVADKLYFFDTATGLPNLNSLLKRGNRLIAKNEICDYTAFFVNIKGFNYINKKVGYKYGTVVFTAFGNTILEKLDGEEIIARLGGDNFVLLVRKEKEDAVINMLRGFEVKCECNGDSYSFIIRSRASIYPINHQPKQFGAVMNHITSVLGYGRNVLHKDFVYCTPEIEQEIARSKSYGQMFSESLDNDEFFVVYQPKVLVTNNSLYGGEALVRWESNGTVHSPSEFIEVLEREHLICRLDFFVLEKTCKMLKKIIDENIEPVRISVNFSNEHLSEDNLVKRILEIVDKYKIPHKYIEIEMTETIDYEESKILRDYVNELQAEGFTVAMDDFGIGYSSLNMLKLVPVDVLKIDKEFITELNSDSNQREKIIIQNIINMAGELGIEVVAEGVETKLQIEMLKNMSCHRIQGFIFDKPLEETEFISRIEMRKYEEQVIV